MAAMEEEGKINTRRLVAGVWVLVAGIMLTDYFAAYGVAVFILYLLPLVLSFFSRRAGMPLLVAAVATLLVILDFSTTPGDIKREVFRLNRGFGIGTMWLVAMVGYHFIRLRQAARLEAWLQAGQAMLAKQLGGEQRLDELGDNVLGFISRYIGVHSAAMFVREGPLFRRAATIGAAAGSVPETVAPGEGLLGQAAKDAEVLLIEEVPEGYLTTSSSLGKAVPTRLLIVPAIQDGEVKAVIELGFFRPILPQDRQLMVRVESMIAVAVGSQKYRQRLKELLDETQRQSEEVQAQSEELRVTNEELAEQGRVLRESKARLELQQTEMEQVNSQLEEQTQALVKQKAEILSAKDALECQARLVEQASRYKSDFLANMSHELRTPLNSSLILAKLLGDNAPGNLTEEQVRYARTIEAAGNDLLALINDVLDLSKIESGHMEIAVETVSLEQVFQGLRDKFEPVAEQKSLPLRIEIGAEVPTTIRTDVQRLEQILKNFLSNALKFTDRGEVALKVNLVPDGRVGFAVKDTGIGIPQNLLRTVFDPFYQSQSTSTRKYGGTGLGLSISRTLADLLGGEITVESVEGEGSTFTLLLPVSHDPASPRPAPGPLPESMPDEPAPRQPQQQMTPAPRIPDDRASLTGSDRIILAVEDDERFAAILFDLAHEMRFRCLIATTAEEALVLAQQYLPSAIVLDVGLPDNSGLIVLERLKADARTRHIPVHVVSAGDYERTALSLGAVGYLLKPVRREQLADSFRQFERRLTRKMRRVLVVEDDPVQVDAMRDLLGSREVEAVAAGTAAECLEHLKSSTFDCMVLDLSLPDTSGFKLLEILSQEDAYSFPPVIVYTGRELSGDEEQMLRRYSKSIIIKGAKSPERLLDEVTLFLHQVVSDLPPEKQRMIEQAANRDAALEGRRVLVVEDDVRNVYALSSLLESRGVKLRIARNGLEALEALENSLQSDGEGVDLVLMDIMMPEMDGLTAMREIRKRREWKKLPIIALTAKAMKDDQQACLEAGASDYLAKPLDVEKLLSLVRVWMPR
jgi:CheY-like chemotaxis protein/signal transduction histidine kinase